MAAKKKRGLSGSPAEHEAEFYKTEKKAAELYKRAGSQAKAGKCSVALNTLIEAAEARGAAETHFVSTDLSFMTGAYAYMPASTRRLFAENCMGSKGVSGLSGMKRRRSRR